MDTPRMRERLKEKGIEALPRKNKDLRAFYKETFARKPTDPQIPQEVPAVKQLTTKQYTYVGSGAQPPQITNFLGRQVFIRGKLTPVSDPFVLKKIKTHACFVEGPVQEQVMVGNDELAKKRAEKITEENVKIQISMERQNRS